MPYVTRVALLALLTAALETCDRLQVITIIAHYKTVHFLDR